MPQHSSKNFYKAEQEEFERRTWDKWVNNSYSYWPYYDYDRDYYNEHGYYGGYGTNNIATHCSMLCDLCYRYRNTAYRKKFVVSYFTPQEILETLQKHLQETNCWCYQRVKSHILRRHVDKLLKSRRSSIDVMIPREYEEDMITECVIKLLDKQLDEFRAKLHNIREKNEKIAILAKYDLTLDDYIKLRRERQEKLDKMNTPQEPTNVLPKQKFIKVKESLLKEGSF